MVLIKNRKPIPFGRILVEMEIISEDQLADVLREQKKNPQRAIGEIISVKYGIPKQKIESIFVTKILTPSIKTTLQRHLRLEFAKFSEQIPFDHNRLTYAIDIESVTLSRTVSTTYTKSQNGTTTMKPSPVETSTRIAGKLSLLIKTTDDELLCEKKKHISYYYEFDTGQTYFDTNVISGIRFILSQKIKEKLGAEEEFVPVTEEELRNILY